MELFKEILIEILSKEDAQVCFPNITMDANALVEMKSYQVLHEIKTVIQDDSFTDPECFDRIEKIISILEENGSDGGFRHDFG